MKATGIVRRVDDLGRIDILKDQSYLSCTTLTPIDSFCWTIHRFMQRITGLSAASWVLILPLYFSDHIITGQVLGFLKN